MSRQWVVLAAKLDPQAVAYFIADRQAGAAVDLNGIANIGAVHEGFRLIRTEDASRRAALTRRLRSCSGEDRRFDLATLGDHRLNGSLGPEFPPNTTYVWISPMASDRCGLSRASRTKPVGWVEHLRNPSRHHGN